MKKLILLIFMIGVMPIYALNVNLEARQLLTFEGQEKLVDVKEVQPGDVIKYILTLKNDEKRVVRGIKPSIPIHGALSLLEEGTTPGYEVTLDGKIYTKYPVLDKDGFPIDLDNYRGIRWKLDELKEEEEIKYFMVVRVLNYEREEDEDGEKKE